ncbi:MAG: LIC_12708 family protein [Rectinemataceae bacterium]
MSYRPALGATCAVLLCVALVLVSCANEEKSVAVRREQLFTLSYGPAEDQLNLFQLDNGSNPLKTRIAMREGIFYIANGDSAKVVRYSSFGDVLSMIYNPEKNPEPVILKPVGSKNANGGSGSAKSAGSQQDNDPANPDLGAGRRAAPYPFRAVGEIAVDSNQRIYVEDRLPPERRAVDKESGAILDYVVLRFDKDGQFIDYLGQEGIGGTPFPYIVGVYTTPSDDCVVVSVTQDSWLVHWFDGKGTIISALRLRRDALPMPDEKSGLIASLDKILPDTEGRNLLIKIDYYNENVDPDTKSPTGVGFASSWIYRMNPRDASYSERWQLSPIEKAVKSGPGGETIRDVRIPALIGAAGDELFFMTGDDAGKTYLSTFDRTTHAMSRYLIDIAPDEQFYDTFTLSNEGILCALLGTRYEARIVWWRFDRIVKDLGPGLSTGGDK